MAPRIGATFFVSICYPVDSGVTHVQIIVNTCVRQPEGIVMIRKPRRGWWYLPGGKVDATETWLEAAFREVSEETGLTTSSLALRGIHLISTRLADNSYRDDRVIVQFMASGYSGQRVLASKEGPVDCISLEALAGLPMNEGDRLMLLQTLKMNALSPVVFGKFIYDEDENLLRWQFQDDTVHTEDALPGR